MGAAGVTGASVSFITMGCAKNEVDSEDMAVRLAGAGYRIIEDPELADVVVVNTCSFIQAATEESIDAILEASGYPRVAEGSAKLVVSGCMPSRYPGELESELPEVTRFVTCAEEDDIVSIIDSLAGIERMPGDGAVVSVAPALATGVSAYVKISDGCDRFCAYCTIPFIRGRYHSFHYDQICADVRLRVDAGVREIVLIAQDTGRWGTDFDESKTLAWLLSSLAEAFPDTWFRVMYIQPEGVGDDLIEAMKAHPNICRYLDIPFQHCDPAILKSMNRKGSAEEFLALIGHVRAEIPDIALRTTLIAGYPGEGDAEFEQLCAFVEDAELDYVGVFAYSREEGTRAYTLEGQVPEEEKLYRTQTIRDLADSLSSQVIAGRVGRVADVLVCGCESDGQLYGRTMSQAPEVDGVTYIDAGSAGQIVTVEIEDTLMYEMEGSVR